MNVGLWLDNLLAYSLQIAALVTVGTVLPLVLKLRHPGVLLHYWQALLVASLLLPVIQPWRALPVETHLTEWHWNGSYSDHTRRRRRRPR